jgi:phytoene dehydrogenase-like protein
MMDYDAVVIGAGHNALAAAVHLATHGWSVGVFERNDAAGGAVRTEEVTLPGFRHDLYAMNLSLFAGSPFVAEHGEALRAHGLTFAPAEHCFASPMRDGGWFGVSKDLPTTLARIEKFSHEDARTWAAMFEKFGADAPHIFALLGSPITLRALIAYAWKAWRAKGTAWIMETERLLVSSPREFLERNFESPEIQATMAAWGMHLDFPPDIAGGALFPYLESMANQSFGMVIGQGGADTVIKALVARLEALGGKVLLNADVAEVRRESGRAVGIRLADGETIGARRAVIAGVTPGALVTKLLPGGSGDSGFDRGAGKFAHAPGTMMLHLAMSHLPDWRAGDELKKFAYVHLAPDLGMMGKAYSEAMSGLLPAEPVLVVGQPTAIDPSRAPAGRHILWVQVRVVPARISEDAAGTIAARDWASAKEAYADRVLDIIEGYAPGTKAKVLARYVESPADLERRNPNLVGGDQLGGSHHLSQNFMFRPMPGWARYATPVKDLYMVGASTWPGAGTGAGSGYMLARMLAG